MLRAFLWLCTFIALLGNTTAYAQPPTIYNHPLQFERDPHRGSWWAPAEPGSGWLIDLSDNDFMFVAYFAYNTDGSPTFYTMYGQLERFDERARRTNGYIARYRSPLYGTANGSCPTCAWRQPSIVEASQFGVAEFRFRDSRHGEFVINGQTKLIEVLDQNNPATQLLGDWQVAAVWGSSLLQFPSQRGLGVWRLREEPARAWQRVGNSMFTPPEEIAQVKLPPPGVREFRLTCVYNCIMSTFNPALIQLQLQPNAIIPDLNSMLFWYDPSTGQLSASNQAYAVREHPSLPWRYEVNSLQSFASPLMVESGRMTFVMDMTVLRSAQPELTYGTWQLQFTRLPASVMD